MGDKTIYQIALENLNYNTHGNVILEGVGHIIASYRFPQFKFNKPEGGRGTQDGGYDRYDPVNKAKLACSIQKEYKIKKSLLHKASYFYILKFQDFYLIFKSFKENIC